jgi:pimeloyl-ACP methyl ester carboxylesterase
MWSKTAGTALAIALAGHGAFGCTCGSGSPASQQQGSGRLDPLHEKSWRMQIPVEGFESASVSVPLGATSPRPVVIVLHGDADRPEWQCGTWRHIAGSEVFVLAPRGLPRGAASGNVQRYTFGSFEQTAQELRAALAALKYRYGSYVAPGPAVLVGFTLGARHALRLLRQEPAFFARVVLVGPAPKAWTPTLAAAFAQRGGQRVLFACFDPGCRTASRRSVLFLHRAGADALLLPPGGARGLDQRMVNQLQREWSWVVSGDPRFSR